MRSEAVQFDRPAPDERATVVREVDVPAPGPGELLLRVIAAGVNFKDVMARRGDAGYVESWPFTPGLEAVGEVVAIGPGVTGSREGDRLVAMTNTGALAGHVVVPDRLVAVLPDGLDPVIAAAAPGALTTAALLVDHVARVRDGDAVVVHSAAGAVGTAVVSLARTHDDVTLVGTVGHASRVDAARRAGYDAVLVRGPQLAERIAAALDGRGADLVLDPQGTDVLDVDLDVVAATGRIVVFGNAGGHAMAELPPLTQLIGANAAVGGFSLAALSRQRPGLLAHAMRGVLDRLADGSLKVDVTELTGLREVAAAQQRLSTGSGDTKYVARVSTW